MTQDLQAKLLEAFNQLSAPDQDAVTAFTEFLLVRSGHSGDVSDSPPQDVARVGIPQPLDIARPAEERVVAAVKRLSRTYPMLDKSSMLGATSDLVTQHVLQGRDAAEVIDELEQAFRDEYQRLIGG